MAYIGNPISIGNLSQQVLSGNGGTTFALDYSVGSSGSIAVHISGVHQNINDYSVSGSTLTFNTSPPTGTNNISVTYHSLPISLPTPGDGTVGINQLSASGTASSSTFLRGDNSWATAGGDSIANGVIRTNAKNITADATLGSNLNGFCAGPITVDSSVTLTINSGSTLTIVGA